MGQVKSFYVLNWDVNHKDVEYYDVIPYFLDTYKEEKRRHFTVFCKGKPETFEEFRNFVMNASRYQFWARCQYEIVVTGFPPQDKEVKLDVHQQIMHNLDLITVIVMMNV